MKNKPISQPLKTISDQSEISEKDYKTKSKLSAQNDTISIVSYMKKTSPRANRNMLIAEESKVDRNSIYDKRVINEINKNRGAIGGPSKILIHNFNTRNLENQFK